MGAMSAMTRRKERAGRAVELAATLLREARAQETPAEIAQARRLARMMEDPPGTELTIALVEALLVELAPVRGPQAYLAVRDRQDVQYISVKDTTLCSQINLVAFRHTVERVKPRLRGLYQQALRHRYRHPDGHLTPKFINP